jgi:malonyl-CoA/methylmalonyl-CoA synthetase
VGVAVVIPKPGVQLDGDRIVAELKSRLANFKIPKRCFVAQELPRNSMGKVQKNLLREQHKQLFC